MTIFRLNFLLKVAHILVCQNPSFISKFTLLHSWDWWLNFFGLGVYYQREAILGRIRQQTPAPAPKQEPKKEPPAPKKNTAFGDGIN